MVAFDIEDIGLFMNKLLKQNAFDQFYLIEGSVSTFADFQIDGALHTDYYTSDEQEVIGERKYCLWSEMKPRIFDLIKGKKLPVQFRFVLQLSSENTRWLLDKYQMHDMETVIKGLYLNIRYQNKKLVCVTGLSFWTFVLDKTLEQMWDETAAQFLKQIGIVYEMN